MTLFVNSPVGHRWRAAAALSTAIVAGALSASGLAAAQTAAAPVTAMSAHGAMHADAMAHMQQMLDAVGATADQKAKIASILHAGFAPMMQMHAEMKRAHASLHALITAPTIDRVALEQLRSREMAALDAASRGMVKAMADAAEVLRPDQRAKLAAMMAKAPAGM